jgi:hypothetical protein
MTTEDHDLDETFDFRAGAPKRVSVAEIRRVERLLWDRTNRDDEQHRGDDYLTGYRNALDDLTRRVTDA